MTTFADDVANLKQLASYRFGNSAVASRGEVAITNLAQLDTHFQAFQDGSDRTQINSEWQRYQDFNNTNFVFGPDELALTAAAGTSVNLLGYCGVRNASAIRADGGETPFSALTGERPDVQIGGLVAISYTGIYRIYAASASGFTLVPIWGTPAHVPEWINSLVFLPAMVGEIAAVNGNRLTLAIDLPPLLTKGMFAAQSTGDGTWCNRTSRVLSRSGRDVELDSMPAGLVGGHWIAFSPALTSGQIWSRDYYAPGFGGHKTIAIEGELVLPPSHGLQRNFSPGNPPLRSPMGAWPALWLYPGMIPGVERDWSEVDILEIWNCNTLDSGKLSGNNHGPWVAAHGMLSNVHYWDATRCWGDDKWYCETHDLADGRPHTFGLVWVADRVSRYFDGEMWRSEEYYWTSKTPGQLGCNLAVGSLRKDLVQNFVCPWSDAALPYRLGVRRLRVWCN